MAQILIPLESAVLLPRESIRPDPDQPRQSFDPQYLGEMAQSIREHGILEPLLVRHAPSNYDGTSFMLIGGERRWRASEGLLEQVPCIIRDVTPAQARELSLVENLQRRDLTAAEEAGVVRDKLEEGLSISQVAARLHKSQGWVNNRIAYLKTGADVRAVGARVTKAMSSLLLVDKVKTPEPRAELLRAVEEEELPHAQVKIRVGAHLEAQDAARRAAEFLKQSQTPPDIHTEERQNAESRSEPAYTSRGLRVTGGPKRNEANEEVKRAMRNLESWIALCDNATFDEAKEFCRRVVRGDLKR